MTRATDIFKNIEREELLKTFHKEKQNEEKDQRNQNIEQSYQIDNQT